MIEISSLEAYRLFEKHKQQMLDMALQITDEPALVTELVKSTYEQLLSMLEAGSLKLEEINSNTVKVVFENIIQEVNQEMIDNVSNIEGINETYDASTLDRWFEAFLKDYNNNNDDRNVKRRKVFWTGSRRILFIVLILFAALSTFAISNDGVRHLLNGFIVERTGEYTSIQSNGKSDNSVVPSDETFTTYDPTYIPNGYELEVEDGMFSARLLMYTYEENRLMFRHNHVGENGTISMQIDTEDAYTESLLINGQSAMYVSKDHEDGMNTKQLVWNGTDGTVFSLLATDMEKESFIKIAKSVKKSGNKARVDPEEDNETLSLEISERVEDIQSNHQPEDSEEEPYMEFEYGDELTFYAEDEKEIRYMSPISVVDEFLFGWQHNEYGIWSSFLNYGRGEDFNQESHGNLGIKGIELYAIEYEPDTKYKLDILSSDRGREEGFKPENIAVVYVEFDITYDPTISPDDDGLKEWRFVLMREDKDSVWLVENWGEDIGDI